MAALIYRAIRLLTDAAAAIAAASVLVMLALVSYSVAMRYFWDAPKVWVDEVVGFMLVGSVMFAVAEALRRGEHISIDLLTEKLSPRGELLRQTWSDLCVLGFAVVLGVSTWEAVGFARSFGSFTPGPIEIESWLPQLPLLAGAVLLGLFAIARLIGRLGRAFAR